MERKQLAVLNQNGHTIRVTIGNKRPAESPETGAMIVPSDLTPEEIRADMHKAIAEYKKLHGLS